MDNNQRQQQQKQEQQEALWPHAESDEVAPGVPVIRTNTPRPMTFEAMMASRLPPEPSEGTFPAPNFPSIAPSAPPLPEEVSDEQEASSSSLTHAGTLHAAGGDTHEFCWLFEYGLEMDPATLNTSERLNGLALLYGKAVLKGYRLLLGSIEEPERKEEGQKIIATIMPDATAGAQVWGVLYRIPKRLTDRLGGSPSVLDSAHTLPPTQDAFQQLRVIVHDVQHDRELSCLTYVASERVRQQLSPIPNPSRDPLFGQRLIALARRHKFPEHYLREEPAPAMSSRPDRPAPYTPYTTATSAAVSHDTDPLPVMTEQRKPSTLTQTLPETPLASSPSTIPAPFITPAALPRPSRLLLAFSVYLVLLLVLAMSFAVLQGAGLWNNVLNEHFAPLNVPWMVMLYGLLGGCVSCLVTLGRYRALHPAAFVLVTWFTRPFVGALMAAFSYLILTSGIFVLDASPDHMPVFLLTGALAGLCESVVLFRRK